MSRLQLVTHSIPYICLRKIEKSDTIIQLNVKAIITCNKSLEKYKERNTKKSLNFPFFLVIRPDILIHQKRSAQWIFFFFFFDGVPSESKKPTCRISNSNSTFEIQIHIQIIKHCLNTKLFHIWAENQTNSVIISPT